MKNTLFLSLLAGLLVSCAGTTKPETAQIVPPPSPSRYPACGGGGMAGGLNVRGNAELARSLRDQKLVCQIGDAFSEGRLAEYAQYRCIGSPTYLRLETYGQLRVVDSVNEAPGGVQVTSSSVSNMPLMPGETGRDQQVSEKITCVTAESFSGDQNAVLKTADWSCSKDVIRALWSKLIADFHAKKSALGLKNVVPDVTFEAVKGENGTYTARSVNISGTAFPQAAGRAKVDANCKVLEAEASIN